MSTLTGNSDAARHRDYSGLLFAGIFRSPAYKAVAEVLLATRRRRALLLLLPAAIFILVLNVGPLASMVRISFLSSYPPSVGVEPTWTIGNYVLFTSSHIFLVPFWRSIVFSTFVTILALVTMYPTAYFLAKLVPEQKRLRLILLLLIPFWAGELIRAFAIVVLLGGQGALNRLMMMIGITSSPLPMLYTPFSLMWGMVYISVLFMFFPLYSAIEKIPRSVLEAASDLGAGKLQRFLRVTLPLSREGITAGCTLVFLISMGAYVVPILIGGTNVTLFSETVASFFHEANDKWPIGAAFGVIMLLASLVIVGVFNAIMNSGGRKARP